MITQTYKQGEHEIKIESAESLQDAKSNGFRNGQYTKFYVNGKLTDNYMAMIRFIVDESKKNKSRLVPSGRSLIEMRNEMFDRQKKSISDQLENLKNQYGEMGIPNNILDKTNDFIDKINPMGIRVKE